MSIPPKLAAIVGRRRHLVAIAAALGALGALAVASIQQPTYQARAVVVVPIFDGDQAVDLGGEQVGDAALGRTLDASRLARTYASLIVEDAGILAYVADTSGRSLDDIEDSVSAANTEETPLVEIVVSSTSRDGAADILRAYVEAVTGPDPVSPSIAPGSLQTVRIEEPREFAPTNAALSVAAGLILGSALGVVVAVFWERSQPRLDVAEDVRAALGLPTRDVAQLAEGLRIWVLKRWFELAGSGGWVLAVGSDGVTVASMASTIRHLAEGTHTPKSDGQRSASDAVASGTTSADDGESLAIYMPVAGRDHRDRLLVRCQAAPGMPGGFVPGDDDDPTLTVLMIARGTAASSVAGTIDALSSTGLQPGYVLLVD